MPSNEGPALEIPALIVVAVAILAVALLIARLSARDAPVGRAETPRQAERDPTPGQPGKALPAVVDQSIGMYLLRRLRGQPTPVAGDESPSLLTQDELAHRIGIDASVPAVDEANPAPPPPPWARGARAATSMGMVVRPAPLVTRRVADPNPAAPARPPSQVVAVPVPVPGPDVVQRRPSVRTAGLALAGLVAMLALAVVAVPGIGGASDGKILDVTRGDSSHAPVAAPVVTAAAPTSEVAGETSGPTDQASAAPATSAPSGQSGGPLPTATIPAQATPRVTARPTPRPTIAPTAKPTPVATPVATPPATPQPTAQPTPEPTPLPTPEPTPGPTP